MAGEVAPTDETSADGGLPVSRQVERKSLGLALMILALGLLGAASTIHWALFQQDGWQVGDYLINWSGGFVRRGLLGEAVLATPLQGTGLLMLVGGLQAAMLAALFTLTAIMVLQRRFTWLKVMLVLSPAFVLFPILYPGHGARKELIGLTAVALLAAAVVRRWPGWVFFVAAGMAAFGALAHEVNALLVPTFGALLYLAERCELIGRRFFWIALGVVATASIAGLGTALLFPGDSDVGAAQCEAITGRGIDGSLCWGGISSLSQGAGDALKLVAGNFPEYFLYVPLIALSLLPIALTRPSNWVIRVMVLQAALLLPLFLVGIDYGRWIYVFTAASSLLILAHGDLESGKSVSVPAVWAIAYVTLWSLPAVGPVMQDPVLLRIAGRAFWSIAPWLNSLF